LILIFTGVTVPAHRMTVLNWTWSLSDWVLLLLATGFLLYVWGTSTYWRFTRQDIPHIKPFPFIGNMGSAIYNNNPFTDTIQENYNQLEGSPYGVMFMFRQPSVLLRDLELIKAVAIKDFEYFTDHLNIFVQKDSVWSKVLINLRGKYMLVLHSVHTVCINCISTLCAHCTHGNISTLCAHCTV
jgi:hypothetical protein